MIEQKVIDDIAEYVNKKIDRVVLNGSYEIKDFIIKEVTQSVIALNYLVPAADVPLITKIELVGPNGVVSSNNVDIPIRADQRMVQEIEVEEG